MSETYTTSTTFTITDARYLSSKVAADMHLCAQYYGRPSEQEIRNYAEELGQLLNGGYVHSYEFGYQRDGSRVICWRYSVNDSGLIDDRPGRLVSTAQIVGASFYNFLWYSSTWSSLTAGERDSIRSTLPVTRVDGAPPGDGNGYWASDRSYSSAGVGLARQTFRPIG